MRRPLLVLIAAVGVGLIAAPAVFQMFTRAPAGGEMIDDFRPFMTEERLGAFGGHLETIDGAHRGVGELGEEHELGPDELAERFPGVAAFSGQWPEIHEEMGGMLTTIRANLDNYEAVDALPSFWMFPWFFVLPGLLLAGIAGSALYTGGAAPVRRWLLVALGAGLIAAPAVFGMFQRAPMGADMISDFEPIMTSERVAQMQGYFLVLAGAEGELRGDVGGLVGEEGQTMEEAYPPIAAFVGEWPQIAADMAPMVGAMADNREAFAGVSALPPFWAFPWFFVLPGVIVIGLAVAAGRPPHTGRTRADNQQEELDDVAT